MRNRWQRVVILWTIIFVGSVSRAEDLSSQSRSDYVEHIKPLLAARCYACHGALKQEASLRLDTGNSIRAGGDSGEAVRPGVVADSLLWIRVTAADASERMPPEGEPLTAEEIDVLRRWIESGAASPVDEQPELDPSRHWSFATPERPALPSGAAHPIDAFLAQAHERNGLTPAPLAQKEVLLRRVYLDLIGLPPSPAELHAFQSDDSPDAYARVVDRLLNSPQYGERWARHWMDIWRYSDWYGRRHVPDVWNSAPQIWRWRDWIVRSLNEDKGYDQMLREMLAADEICPEDAETSVATGYLIRNWYALNPNDWMRNTVEHTGKAFLGLTFNCAHCHDHKYDPIAQQDYFRLRAFFEPIYVRQDRVPGEADPGPFQDYQYSTLRKIQRLGLVRVFDKEPKAPTWFYTGGDERNRVTERGSIAPGIPAFLAESVPLPAIETRQLPPRSWYPGLQPEIQATILADAREAVRQAEQQLAATPDVPDVAAAVVAGDVKQQVDGEEASGQAGAAQVDHALPALRRRSAAARLDAAQARLASAEARIAADRGKYGETAAADATALAQAASRQERVAALRSLEAERAAQELARAVAEAKPADDPKRSAEIEAATKQLATLADKIVAAATAAEDTSSESYTAFSPTYPQTSTGRRTALAAWMTRRDHPLTARVAVNHIWARHFHAPLVATVYDFGRNGALPSHPQLLDWLAVELMESGWSMKHLHRLIVTSDAYRRVSSGVTGQAADPENRLLWKMNVGRMEAEIVRDSLLAVAGQLDQKMGGQELENSESLTTHRRSLYYSVYPEQGGKSAMGELFDAPDPLECYRRTRSVVPQQALALTNSKLVHDLSRKLVADWQSGVGTQASANPTADPATFVTQMYARLLTRAPSPAERHLCIEYLKSQRDSATQRGATPAAEADDKGPLPVSTQAYESLVRALLNHNDFITIR